MTMAQQILDTIRNGVDTVRERSMTLRDRANRRTRRLTATDAYLWLGIASLGLAGLAALTLRPSRLQAIPAPWRSRKVGDVMVRGVVTIHPSATLLAAAQLMRDANVGVLPIVENGALRGLVTDRDLVVRAIARGVDPEATPVRYFESDELIAAQPEWDVEEALQVIRTFQIGRLPVVDDNGQLVGIVTLSSLALRSPEDGAFEAAKEVARRSARAA